MTDKEKLEGIVLLAEFDGYEVDDRKQYARNSPKSHWIEIENLYYATSLDWLNPVVVKCKGIMKKYDTSFWYRQHQDYHNALDDGHMENAFKAVIRLVEVTNQYK